MPQSLAHRALRFCAGFDDDVRGSFPEDLASVDNLSVFSGKAATGLSPMMSAAMSWAG